MRSVQCLLWVAIISTTGLGQSAKTPKVEHAFADASSPVADFKKKTFDDWAKLLPGLLPAIQKCVNDGSVPALFVVKAWPVNHEMVAVRLLTVHRKQYECVAAKTGMRLESIKPAVAGDPRSPQKWNPIFYPAREAPPSVECGRVERVMEKKMFAGWLQYDPCEGPGAPTKAEQ